MNEYINSQKNFNPFRVIGQEKMKNPTQITVTLTQDQIRKIKEEANKKNISYSATTRYIINYYFENQQIKQNEKIIDMLQLILNKLN